jgi:hypothetical protein
MDDLLKDHFTGFVTDRVDSVKVKIGGMNSSIKDLEKTNRNLYAAIMERMDLLADKSYQLGFKDAMNLKQVLD